MSRKLRKACKWAISRAVLPVLLAACLPLLAHAQAAGSPPAPAAGAKDTADTVVRTFTDALKGTALLVGVTETEPELDLKYHAVSNAGQGIVEQYRGQPSRGILASLESPAAQDLLPIDKAGVWMGAVAYRFTTTYGTFQLQQTLQTGTAGKTEAGTVNGDFLGFAIPLQFYLVRNSDVLPIAFGLSAGLGKAFVRYRAPLHYSVNGTEYTIDVQNDGYYPRNMIFAGVELRVWNVLLRVQSFDMTGGESYARYHGRRVFTFQDDFTLNLKTLAYVWNF